MQTLYRLTLDGRSYGYAKTCIRQVAADAIDCGLATPDRQGRIVLHETADIEEIKIRCSESKCKSPGKCAAAQYCARTGSCNCH